MTREDMTEPRLMTAHFTDLDVSEVEKRLNERSAHDMDYGGQNPKGMLYMVIIGLILGFIVGIWIKLS